MRTKISLLVGALALVIGPDAGLTQYPVGGNGQGRGGSGKSQDYSEQRRVEYEGADQRDTQPATVRPSS